VLIAAYVLIALLYAYFNPIYEAPDEVYHFAMIQKLATDGQLAVQDKNGPETAWNQQGSQPPLYYALGAVLVTGLDRSDYEATRQFNPHVILGEPGRFRNKNFLLHDQLYPPPLYGTTLAVYIVRLLSIFCGAVTVYALIRAAQVIAPQQPAVLYWAVALTAFNPQFLFISSAVNNDNLVTAFASVIVWQTLVMLRDGFAPRRSLLLGVLVALACISKLSGLTMGLVVALVAVWVLWKRRDWRGFLTLALAGALAWLLLAGWWYLRNWVLYGEWFGNQTMLDIFGRRTPTPDLLTLFQTEFEGLRISYWGLFGWFNVYAPRGFYVVMDALTALGLVGWLVSLVRARRDGTRTASALWLGVVCTAGIISFISWTLQVYATQGRLLFTFITALSLTLAMGLSALRLPARWGLFGMMGFAALLPFLVLYPTYAPTPTLTELPASATPTDIHMGDEFVLVGYETADRRYVAEEYPAITLYWKVLAQPQQDFSVSVQLLQGERVLGEQISYPGYGAQRTSLWQSGQIYYDVWQVERPFWILPDENPAQFQMDWSVSLWKADEGWRLPITTSDGAPVGMTRLRAGGYAQPAPAPSTLLPDDRADAHFDGMGRLKGYDWNAETGDFRLYWQAETPLPDDWVVGVHVMGADGQMVTQADGEPQLPTRYWQAGDVLVSDHHLDVNSLPAGAYQIELMWYARSDGHRLSNGTPDSVLRALEFQR
jgi:4-amino-4-deoxy-L-arabinose transferase-like glycosyltransferase